MTHRPEGPTHHGTRELLLAAGRLHSSPFDGCRPRPDALPSPSVAPYTSKPLLFRREGADGFVVYSAGPQGDYNGGKPGERVIPGQSGFRYPVPKTPAPVEAAH